MSFVFCPYSGMVLPESLTTREHIVPESLGGTLGFSIRVHGEWNARLGSEVDAPFIDGSAINFLRMYHGVRGKRRAGKAGEAPWFDTTQVVPLFGIDVPLTVKVRRDEVRILPYSRPHQDEKGPLHIVGGPKDAQTEARLEEVLRKKAARRGAAAPPLQRERAELMLRVKDFTTRIERDVSLRFFAKMALATAHLVLGEGWTRSVYAESLRAIIRRELDPSASPGYGLMFTSEGTEPTCYLPFDSTPEEHEVVLLRQGSAVWFYASLFHHVAARFRLLDTRSLDDEGLRQFGLPDGPVAYGINFVNRGVRFLKLTPRYDQDPRGWPEGFDHATAVARSALSLVARPRPSAG